MPTFENVFGSPAPNIQARFIGQYATFGDLPTASNYADGTVAYVRGASAFYKTQSNSWIVTGVTNDAVESLAKLKEITGTARDVIYLDADGRRGFFQWDASDLSTRVTNDSSEGVYVPPDSDSTGASGAWVRSAFLEKPSEIYVEWFGAKGSGSAGDAAANNTAINAAIEFSFSLTTTAADDSRGRGGPEIRFGHGRFPVNDNVFGSFSGGDKRTLRIRGAGWYNTILYLAQDGAFGDYTADHKILFPFFMDMHLAGDAKLSEGQNTVSSARYGIISNSAGNQGFKFVNVLFSRFGTCFYLHGENNESEFVWVNCKATRFTDWLVISSLQALNFDHFGCSIEQYGGSLVKLVADPDTGGTPGGGNVNFYGGSIIPFSSGSSRYLVELYEYGNSSNNQVVYCDNVRFELRGNDTGIVLNSVDKSNRVIFNSCAFLINEGSAGNRNMADMGQTGHALFRNCVFNQTDASTQVWTVTGSSSQRRWNGGLRFEQCENPPQPSNITFSGLLCGSVTSVGGIPPSPVSTTSSSAILDYTLHTDEMQKYRGIQSGLHDVHQVRIVNQRMPKWDSGSSSVTLETTATLPAGAVIRRIFIYSPPQGTSSAGITYRLEDGAGNVLHDEAVAQQKSGVVIDLAPADLAGGFAQARVGASNNDGDIKFTIDPASSGSHQFMDGFGFIEYI